MKDMEDDEYFWCPFCNKKLPVEDGVIVHDNVPHEEDYVFGSLPQ